MTTTDRSKAGGDPGGTAQTDHLCQLGYVSTQTRHMGSQDLIELLNFARDSNHTLGVTGLLLHREDAFFQLIEGPEDVVSALFERICADRRHHRVERLFVIPIRDREFSDWKMAFVDLDAVDLTLLPAYSTFLSSDAEPRRFLKDLSRGKRLALMFKDMQ